MSDAHDPLHDEDRERRIAELETRLSRPPGVGVLPPVAAIALAGALAMMWLQRDDLAYFFSSREPIDLGVEGAYRFDLAQTNRYAQLHGVPTSHGAYWMERDETYLAIGVRETPLLVRRATFPNEAWAPGSAKGPPPDQRPFSVRGRLLSRADASKYEDAFKKHDEWAEVGAKWMLLAEQRPGGDYAGMMWFSVLLAFAGVNVWLLVRGVVAFLKRRKPARSRE